jgi:type I restriction enzyme R subunit
MIKGMIMNQTPEQMARDNIDRQLSASGWIIQNKKQMNLNAGLGVAVREYQTDAGPADYVLFVDVKPVGIIEAKREEEGVRLTAHEDQSKFYAGAILISPICRQTDCGIARSSPSIIWKIPSAVRTTSQLQH